MDWLVLIILAEIQGVAEFLPISSSGHLALGTFWTNLDKVGEGAQTELSITLHAGSLLSILVFYRKRIIDLLWKDMKVIPMLIVGTIPVAIIGLSIKKGTPWLLESWSGAFISSIMFLVTAAILILMNRYQNGDKDYVQIDYKSVLLIGLFQGFAILPGISRSGSTIFAGMLTGLKRDEAATFSFLLAIPAIMGASCLEMKEVIETGSVLPWQQLLTGFIVSFVVGWFALVLLVKFVNQGKLGLFAFWLIPLGIISFTVLMLQANGILPVDLLK